MKICRDRAFGRGRLAVLSAALLTASALPALAVGNNWTAGTGSWFTAGNWGIGVPTTGDNPSVSNGGTANVDGSASTNTVTSLSISGGSTVNVQGGSTLNATSINVGNGAGNAGTLLISGTGIGNNGTVSATQFNLNNGTLSVTATGAQISVVSLNGTSNIFSAASGSTMQINGSVSGGAGAAATIAGGGFVIYTLASTYTGGTTINSGSTLILGNSAAAGDAGSGAIVDNGTLSLSHGTNGFSLSNAISGTGGIQIAFTNTGSVSFNGGAKTYSGTTSILGGKLIVTGTTQISSTSTFAVSSGATFDIQQTSPTLSNLTGAGTVLIDQNDIGGQTLTLTNANFTGNINQNTPGPIGGGITIVGQNLVQLGGGTSILAGANNWTGTTTINTGGTLQIGNGGAGATLPTGAITDNGTLIVNHSDNLTYAGTISGSGILTQSGTGTLTFTGTNNLTGGTSVTGGVLNFNSLANFGSGRINLNGGTLQWATGTSADISSILTLGTTGGILDTNGNNVTLASVIGGAGGFIKTGSGVLTLTAANTYTGGTSIAGGTLSLGNSSAAGTGPITTTGSVIDYASGDVIANAIFINSNTTQLQVLTGTATQSGIIAEISGPRPLEKIGAGTLILTGTNTYTGPTTITAGTLQIGAGGTAGSIASTSIIDNASLVLNRSDSVTFAGVISGSGTATQAGSGTLILTGVNTYTGTTTVAAGALQVGTSAITTAVVAGPVAVSAGANLSGYGKVGALSNSGTVTPGGIGGTGIGTLTAASFTQASGGTLSIEVSPTSASQLKSTGAVTAGGTLALVFDPGVYAAKTYAIVTGSSVTGTFATVTGTVPTSGLAQSVSYAPAEIDLVLGAPASAAAPVIVAPTNDTIYTALTSAGIEAAHSANMTVLGRLSDRRGSRNLDGSADQTTPTGADLWVRGNFNGLSANASTTAPSYSAQNGGFLAGVDWAWGPKFILGVDGGYARNSVSEAGNLSRGGISAFRLGGYGGYAAGPLSLDASLGWASDSISARRTVAVGTATSSHGANEFTAAFQVGYAVPVEGAIILTPNAGLNYASLTENGITESGASGFNLSAAGRSTSSVRPYVGETASRAFHTDDGTDITPQIQLGFSSELGDARRNMTVTTASGSNFAVIGVAPSRDFVDVGTGVTVQSRADLAFYGHYDALLFSNVTVHTVTAGLQYRF